MGTHQTTGTRIFASRDPEIAAAKNKAARDRTIKALVNPRLERLNTTYIWNSWLQSVRLKPQVNLSENSGVFHYLVSAMEYIRTVCGAFFEISKGKCTNSSNDVSPSSESDLGLVVSSELASGRAGLIVPRVLLLIVPPVHFLAILFLRNVLMAYLTLKIRKVFFLVYIAVSSFRFYQ